MRHIKAALLAVLAIATLSGCNREPKFWKDAEREQTVEAYETYVRECPTGPNIETARACLEKLRWDRAQAENTEAAYAEFLARFPNSPRLSQAREAQAATAWAAAESAGTPEAIAAFRAKYPGSTQDARAADRLALADGKLWWKSLADRAAKIHSAPHATSFRMIAPDGSPITAQAVMSATYPEGTKLEVILQGDGGMSKTITYQYAEVIGISPVFSSAENGPSIVIGGQILIPMPTPRESFRDDLSDPVYQWKTAILAQTDAEMRKAPFSKYEAFVDVIALIPVPGTGALVDNPAFKARGDAAEILANRAKVADVLVKNGAIAQP